LPAASAPLERTMARASAPPLAGRSGTILLAEDDEVVRAAARRALEELGYDVAEASDGAAALRLADDPAFGPAVAAVIDLVMPELDGRATLGELRRRYPGLPVLVTSGRWRQEEEAELLAAGASGVLPKPFDLVALSAALDKLAAR
jgi:CheY-like chemotaxis protein